MNFPDDLKPGDILLYSSGSLVDKLIEWKEGGNVAHIEIFAGQGAAVTSTPEGLKISLPGSWASRNGLGVGLYQYRPDGLVAVRRPCALFDPRDVVPDWFAKVNGEGYGWADIFATVGFKSDKSPEQAGEDCSHFAAVLLETAGCPQFDPSYPKQTITPDDFQKVRESIQIWHI